MLVPEGTLVYNAQIGHGNYEQPQDLSFQHGGEVPADLGVFKSEPELWIGFSVNSTQKLPQNDPFAKNWTHRYDPQILHCVHMESKYTVG